MTLTKERLEEIKARCDAASPGGWGPGHAVTSADIVFVLCARQDVPDLVAEVERLRAAIVATERYGRACFWCGPMMSNVRHTSSCPVFTPNGEIKCL